jgi:hypothetical protein
MAIWIGRHSHMNIASACYDELMRLSRAQGAQETDIPVRSCRQNASPRNSLKRFDVDITPRGPQSQIMIVQNIDADRSSLSCQG